MSKFPWDQHEWSNGLGRRTLSRVDELRIGFVAFEVQVKARSEERSEMWVGKLRELICPRGVHAG